MRTVTVLGLVALALAGGPGQAAAGQPSGAYARQIGPAARPEPVPEPRPSAPPPSAPAGDRRGNAVVTAAALLLALVVRPIRRRRRRSRRPRRRLPHPHGRQWTPGVSPDPAGVEPGPATGNWTAPTPPTPTEARLPWVSGSPTPASLPVGPAAGGNPWRMPDSRPGARPYPPPVDLVEEGQEVRHAFIAAQLLWQAQAALDAEADEPRAQAGTSNHRLRHVLVGV
jgi:hypothetical protein